MEVYIEYVILDNLIINFIILLLTVKMLRLNVAKYKLFLSSLIGTVFAVIMPFLVLMPVLIFIIKILVGVVMVSLLKRYSSALQFITTFLVFLTVTFAMGGLCFAIIYFLNNNIANAYLLVYEGNLPIGIIILAVSIYAYFMFNLIKIFYKKKLISNFIFEVSICNANNVVKTKAYLDTGNRLVDKTSKKPIVVINFKVFNELYKRVKLTDVLLGKLENLPLRSAGFMSINGVSGKKSKILTFEVDSLKIFLESEVNIIENATLALTFNKFKDEMSYDVLLNPLIFNF
jgi:stage II sporulation protein GA (sporulation sigma-E factor processing peptidase)